MLSRTSAVLARAKAPLLRSRRHLSAPSPPRLSSNPDSGLLSHSHHLLHSSPGRCHPRTAHSYNAFIAKLSRSGFPQDALHLFFSMRASYTPVDEFTLPAVLRSCTALGLASSCHSIHGLSVRLGLEKNLYVASALVLCYSNLGEIPLARRLFDEMPCRDAVLWTSLLSGYAQSGEPEFAFEVFKEMVAEGIQLDGVVVVSLLLACGQLGWLRHGKSMHGFSVRACLGLPLTLGNALVDMYVKCGAFSCAERVFSRMPKRDVISWTALILGHGLNGRADVALSLFKQMHVERIEPNSVTFLGVLSACGHAGMVKEAWAFFDMMKRFRVKPELKHYACMVDALGRAGEVEEGEKFVEDMPIEPDEAILGALMAGCRLHGNFEVGMRVSKRLLRMRPDKSGYYMALANMYSDAGRFHDAERVRTFMKQINVSKLVGCSLVELDIFL